MSIECFLDDTQQAIDRGTYYIFDYLHYSMSTYVDSLRYFITSQVYNQFKTQFVSTYEKFVASLQGKNIPNPALQKEMALLGNETLRLPSITFDPSSLEPDDLVTPFLWNYVGTNMMLETAISKGINAEDKLLIYPHYAYMRINIDIHAVFNSPYQKLDFDFRLLQYFRGLNRLTEPYQIKAYIPLPKKLMEDYPDIDWNTALPDTVVDLIRQTGETMPHFCYPVVPKLTLTSLADASEKYGSLSLPEFKSSFSVIMEGFFITSLLTLPLFVITDSVANISQGESYKKLFSMIFYRIKRILRKFNIIPETKILCQFVIEFITRTNKTLTDILRCMAEMCEEICITLSELIQIYFNKYIPPHIICQLFSDIPIPEIISTGGLFSIDLMYKCTKGGKLLERTINYIIEENLLDYEQYIIIPKSSWGRFNEPPLIVSGTINRYEIDENEVRIYGPLFKGQVITLIF